MNCSGKFEPLLLEAFKKYPDMSYVKISKIVGCSPSRAESVSKKHKLRPSAPPKHPKTAPGQICTCCHRNPKGENLRFLCKYCYQANASDVKTTP